MPRLRSDPPRRDEVRFDSSQVVVGVDPGKNTAVVAVQNGTMLNHKLVDTGGDIFDAILNLRNAILYMVPNAIVVEFQIHQRRMIALQAAVIALAIDRGIPCVQHFPSALHRYTRPTGGHTENKHASLELARRLWGAHASRIEAEIAGPRKHDVAEAYLMAMLYTGWLDAPQSTAPASVPNHDVASATPDVLLAVAQFHRPRWFAPPDRADAVAFNKWRAGVRGARTRALAMNSGEGNAIAAGLLILLNRA